MQGPRHLPERPPLPGSGYMDDYTTAFLWSAGVLVFMALLTLWAALGFPAALVAATVSDRLILRRARR